MTRPPTAFEKMRANRVKALDRAAAERRLQLARNLEEQLRIREAQYHDQDQFKLKVGCSWLGW